MINVIDDNGIETLDLESYLSSFKNVRVNKDLTIRVGLFTVESIQESTAVGQAYQERKKKAEKEGKPLDEMEVYTNLVDQMMCVLKKDNPELKREQIANLPPAAINSLFRFLMKHGMGLEKGLGNEELQKVAQDTTASV